MVAVWRVGRKGIETSFNFVTSSRVTAHEDRGSCTGDTSTLCTCTCMGNTMTLASFVMVWHVMGEVGG
jgi:hypothetical protein